MRVRCTAVSLSLALLLASGCSDAANPAPTDIHAFGVVARGETSPSEGDVDDVAIWHDPVHPSRSLIVATDKSGGIMLYELDGSLRQERRDGQLNNVDLREDVEIGGQWARAALIAASNTSSASIELYTIDPDTRLLVHLASFPSDIGTPYGLCNYRSPVDGRLYVIIDDKRGAVAQYEVLLEQPGAPTLALRRTLLFAGQLEGCVADDRLARLYLGEEDLGIWRINAEPDSDSGPVLIHDISAPYLSADVEGLAIYEASRGDGYLIASSQGSNTYAIFERGGSNPYVTSFRIVAGNIIDAALESDGIEVSSAPLGPLWADGLFIAQDDHNEGFSRNFKLVSWGDIVAAADVELLLDPK